MTRILASLSAAAVFAAAASAQCLPAPAGAVQTLTEVYAPGTFPADDEGRTLPAVPLGFTFPMAGALPLAPGATHAYIESNGEIYLTNLAYGIITGPGVPAIYGITSLNEMRGVGATAVPRIVAWGGDNEAGNGGNWAVLVDTSVPNQCRITHRDMWEYTGGAPVGSCTFSVTLYSTGVIDFDYSSNGSFPTAPFAAHCGVSIGNSVGTTTTPASDLSAGGNSGALGLVYEVFNGPMDLEDKRITFTPNGLGGYTFGVSCQSAFNKAYGAGCYAIANAASSFYELYADFATAKAVLDGNAMTMTPIGANYVATWNAGGGAGFLAPGGGATVLPADDDGDTQITPSSAVPIPGGSAATITVSTNGILTMSNVGNNSGDFSPTGADMVGANALNSGHYVWADFNSNFAGSGFVKYEEVGGVLYITWDGVYCYGSATPNPSTFQYQINLTTGIVQYVWSSMDGTSTNDVLVGFTAPGTSPDPGSIPLVASLPIVTGTNIAALALSASPAPVNNGVTGTTVTYTVSNIPEYIAGSGLYIATMFLSTAPLPGIDLGFIGAPGCLAHIATLDVNLSVGPVPIFPTQTATFFYPPGGAIPPGTDIWCQAVALYDVALQPAYISTGNTFGLLTSNGVQSHVEAF